MGNKKEIKIVDRTSSIGSTIIRVPRPTTRSPKKPAAQKLDKD